MKICIWLSLENSLENSGAMIDGVRKTKKKQERGFLGMLWRTLGASMLENTLTGKGVMRATKRVIRAWTGSNIDHMRRNF